ncbi:MAG TPA: GTP diphosphokinase, partial [Gammaproteobacteria bacterium]|nr:GTP diphosphokinase [Gammaproteobacteria bacterium]
MHRHAELGVAAHWHYKESGGGAAGGAALQQMAWLRQMLESQGGAEDDDDDLLERFKAEALNDRVYAITPKGTIVELPQGATPLDFAYHVHT